MSTAEMPVTSAATFCATLVDEWVAAGCRDAVVCPGSRSTPLALALADDERVRVHVHHDERAGSFMALGFGAATGRPAIVVTTSGTAAAELHPAVVEAHHNRVPLIVCTADRPPELRDVGAPQAIDQSALFTNALRWYFDPGVPDAAASETWRSWAARAVLEAQGSPAGPVHLNLPFRDPLVGRPGPLPPARPDGAAWHVRQAEVRTLDDGALESLTNRCRGQRGVIVAGGAIEDPVGVILLGDALGWPVLADPRSGCRVADPVVVAHFDSLLRRNDDLDVDVILALGSSPASKVLGQWRAAQVARGAIEVQVDRDGRWFDPSHDTAITVRADPGRLCRDLASRTSGAPATGTLARWRAADDDIAAHIERVLGREDVLTEPGVARETMASLPDGATLVVSSSMPVRDLEWYAAPRTGVRVVANRGANGIDGVVSTAVGVALSGCPTAVLVGDVAFLHDTNALLGLARRPVDLVIVVVDNDGGGIFSFLPQADVLSQDQFEQLFGTPHGVDLTALGDAHGIDVMAVAHAGDLAAAVAEALRKGGTRIVVARSDRADNVGVHRELNGA